MGRTILTARILTDTSRLYWQAWDFWQLASPAQRRRLRGFSLPLLAVAVHQAVALEKLDGAHRERVKAAAGTRDVGDRGATAAYASGMALRDQASDALLEVAMHDDGLSAEVDAARGTAEDDESVAAGLDALGKLVRAWRKSKRHPDLAGRMALANLDAAYAKELEAAAAEIRKRAAKAAFRPTGGALTQGALDRADGINVLLLGQIIRAFDAAHAIDPTIPRLQPIATWRLFFKKSKKKGEAATASAPAKQDDAKSTDAAPAKPAEATAGATEEAPAKQGEAASAEAAGSAAAAE